MSDSILQVNLIKDKGGNATGITVADSTANVTINNLTSSTGFPDGHVIQVVSNQNSDYFDCDSDWRLLESTELTNVKANSHVLIHALCNIRHHGNVASGVAIRLYRGINQTTHGTITTGTNVVNHSGNEDSIVFTYTNKMSHEGYFPTSFTFLDTAPTTGTVSYGSVAKLYAGSVDSQHDGLSIITAMEIAR